MHKPLVECLDGVEDEASFLVFVQALQADFATSQLSQVPASPYGPAPGGWENTAVGDFLEAGLAWAASTGFGRTQGQRTANPWQRCARLLYCGKVYE